MLLPDLLDGPGRCSSSWGPEEAQISAAEPQLGYLRNTLVAQSPKTGQIHEFGPIWVLKSSPRWKSSSAKPPFFLLPGVRYDTKGEPHAIQRTAGTPLRVT